MQRFSFHILLLLTLSVPVLAQEYRISKPLAEGSTVHITNRSGRVSVGVQETAEGSKPAISVLASSEKGVAESEIKLVEGARMSIEVAPSFETKQIDLAVLVPLRSRVVVETEEGAVDVAGNLESIDVTTETGTVTTDIPDDAITYDLQWTRSRPRFLADFELSKVKEGSGGKFTIKGKYPSEPKKRSKPDSKRDDEDPVSKSDDPASPQQDATGGNPLPSTSGNSVTDEPASEKSKKKKVKDKKDDTSRRDVALHVTTGRGIVLLNVDTSEVGSDLRERPLTNAAKAIVRSGDSFLMDAIRRASPKYFGDYMRTLPPAIREPYLNKTSSTAITTTSGPRTMLVNVTDNYNRSVADLDAKDFEIVENGEPREVMSVRPVTAPFNLVLLLDVSGSVDNYVNFIRKAARQFVETMGPQDRIAIITFNDDVHQITTFTTDKSKLSESLDTFDAGGGTAYYDALAFTLTDVLRPMRGERTAVVVLTDGDDNRSFLPFDALRATIQESGALIYPLYVPSTLIAASEGSLEKSVDWLRQKYMGLTAKAEGEGEKLAKASGGVYYPITQLAQIQTAYDDIAKQLRTAYSVTYRSAGGTQARLRVKVKRENAFVKFANQ
jgi:VWFA-related protein